MSGGWKKKIGSRTAAVRIERSECVSEAGVVGITNSTRDAGRSSSYMCGKQPQKAIKLLGRLTDYILRATLQTLEKREEILLTQSKKKKKKNTRRRIKSCFSSPILFEPFAFSYLLPWFVPLW